MNTITIGVDVAKSVVQLHGEDAAGRTVLQKRLKRSQVAGFLAKLPPRASGSRPARRIIGGGRAPTMIEDANIPESEAGGPRPPKTKADGNPLYLLATLYGGRTGVW